MVELDEISKVQIRDVWGREPEFSAWLAEEANLAKLGEKIGVSLVADETEADVGDFSADIVAHEDETNKVVIIENQYEKTDHDHLGKILTYAAGKDAKLLVWITEEVRDEHRAAVEWMNNLLPEDMGFFLLKIELIKIGNSKPAPIFTVIESPNNWKKAKMVSTSTIHYPCEGKYSNYWNAFGEYLMNHEEEKKQMGARNARHSKMRSCDYPGLASHIYLSFAIGADKNCIEAMMVMKKDVDPEVYNKFYAHKDEIEADLGTQLAWTEKVGQYGSKALISRPGDYSAMQPTEEDFKWFIEMGIKIRNAFKKVYNTFE